MFDGDKAGLSAAYKTSLMSLPLITSKKFLQLITLPKDLDPDSYINNHSKNEFIKILKNPIPLVNFIFNQSSNAFSLKNADDKVIYDKYLDDLVKTITDKKIRYFYQNEFKTLFFQKIRLKTNQIKIENKYYSKNKLSLYIIQIQSFIASYINHKTVRKQIKEELINSNLLDSKYVNLLNQISKSNLIDKNEQELIDTLEDEKLVQILKESLKSKVYKLFPYSSFKFDDQKALIEIKESCLNLNTRLSNLKKINKSLSNFIKDSTQLNWQELQEINKELLNDE